jgi:hypothetical protein
MNALLPNRQHMVGQDDVDLGRVVNQDALWGFLGW